MPIASPARNATAGTGITFGFAWAVVAALAFPAPVGAMESALVANPVAAPAADFAYGVALLDATMILGAPGQGGNSGAAYLADCSTLPCSMPVTFAPVDLLTGDAFGSAVAASADTWVATAPGAEPGAAYVYVREDADWTLQTRLTPSGATAGERFGLAAALAGDVLVVGADRADTRAGAVYVFARSGSTWTQQARLVATDAAPNAAFGSALALDGDTLLVGAPFKAANVAGSYAQGVVYVYTRSGEGTWSEQARLVANDGASGDLFGFSVGLDGDSAVVGAPYAAQARGAAYVFARSSATWTQQAKLGTHAGAAGDEFGWSVALGDTRVIVGAPFAGQLTGTACGAGYVFDGGSLTESAVGTVAVPLPDELAGWSVAASGERWIASAPGHVIGDIDHAGAAYWFDAGEDIFGGGFEALPGCVAAEGP